MIFLGVLKNTTAAVMLKATKKNAVLISTTYNLFIIY